MRKRREPSEGASASCTFLFGFDCSGVKNYMSTPYFFYDFSREAFYASKNTALELVEAVVVQHCELTRCG